MKTDWGIAQVEIPKEEVELKEEVVSQPYRRKCNRCNKGLEHCIADEPRCNNCGCPEFRWVINTNT